MKTVLAFHHKEIPLVEKLARWIIDLGGSKGHEIMLAPSWAVFMAGDHKLIEELFSKAFGAVTVMQPVGEDEYGWPDSANFAWRSVVSHMENNLAGVPWFWFEPDSVPLCADWLDRIEAEWKASGKAFLGARVEIDNIPPHMTGIAVYSQVKKFIPNYAAVQYQIGYHRPQVAWDVQHRGNTLPNAHITELIQHEWKPEPFVDAGALSRVKWGEAVIYHQSKDGSLIDRMREKEFIGWKGSKVFEPCYTCGGSHNAGEPVDPKCNDPVVAPMNPHVPEETIADRESEHPFAKPRITVPFENVIFTYFLPVDEIDRREQEAMIDLWMYSWRLAGWNPAVLNRIGTKYADLLSKFESFPSINPGTYDRNCFMRWLAVAEMGGGFMCDYDVLNNGLKPFSIPSRLTVYQTENACPSFVGGSSDEFLRMARIFAERGKDFIIQENGHGAHVSDMHIIQGIPEEYDQKSIVKPYGGRGWGMARAVHFANQTMNGKKPRSKWIPHLMYQREPR